MAKASDFKKGDRVIHAIGSDIQRGEVETITEDGAVRVKFDHIGRDGKHWYGEYDKLWFRLHPNYLSHET